MKLPSRMQGHVLSFALNPQIKPLQGQQIYLWWLPAWGKYRGVTGWGRGVLLTAQGQRLGSLALSAGIALPFSCNGSSFRHRDADQFLEDGAYTRKLLSRGQKWPTAVILHSLCKSGHSVLPRRSLVITV